MAYLYIFCLCLRVTNATSDHELERVLGMSPSWTSLQEGKPKLIQELNCVPNLRFLNPIPKPP
ncbi:hypothetical protein Fmac_002951 [Flemingia macrophylla]|uniref:Uncharacterized protein n=1 Tax=Flemingia macrophylla TaxID=520843 RepID=A0ABD1NLI8_9FABA